MYTRRVVIGCLVAVLVLAMAGSAWTGARVRAEQMRVYYRTDMTVLVDGQRTSMNVTPFIVDPGWIMVPAEFVSKELGATVSWDDATSTFSIRRPVHTDLSGQLASANARIAQLEAQLRQGTDLSGQLATANTRIAQLEAQLAETSSGSRIHTESYAGGDSYVGEMSGGQRHGLGTYTWSNGNRHVGEFRHDERHGLGVHQWADGTTRGGLWVRGVLSSADAPTPTTPDPASRGAIEAEYADAVAQTNRRFDDAIANCPVIRTLEYYRDQLDRFAADLIARREEEFAARGIYYSSIMENAIRRLEEQREATNREWTAKINAKINEYERQRQSELERLRQERDSRLREAGY